MQNIKEVNECRICFCPIDDDAYYCRRCARELAREEAEREYEYEQENDYEYDED